MAKLGKENKETQKLSKEIGDLYTDIQKAKDTSAKLKATPLAIKLQELEGKISIAKESVLQSLIYYKLEALGGMGSLAQVKKDKIYIVDDHEALFKWISKTKNFQVCNTISQPAVREILDSGVAIPGLKFIENQKLSLIKR